MVQYGTGLTLGFGASSLKVKKGASCGQGSVFFGFRGSGLCLE